MEKLMIIGNLGSDPEMRFAGDGTPVTNFSVAVNRTWKNKDGSKGESTKWFRIAVWGAQAEPCNQYLKKGRQVYVEGRVDASAWSDKNTGEARAGLEVTAINVQFLGGRDDSNSHAGSNLTEEEIPF